MDQAATLGHVALEAAGFAADRVIHHLPLNKWSDIGLFFWPRLLFAPFLRLHWQDGADCFPVMFAAAAAQQLMCLVCHQVPYRQPAVTHVSASASSLFVGDATTFKPQ